jgi:hypothetical protein
MEKEKADLVPSREHIGGVHSERDINAMYVAGRDIVTEEKTYDVQGLPNPYLGLDAFSYDNRASFGGREKADKETVEKIITPGTQRSLLFIIPVRAAVRNPIHPG